MSENLESVHTIYLDAAATTPIDPAVLDAMMPYLTEEFGNPSGLYRLGRQARAGIDNARSHIAGCLGVQEDTIFFTSGGTESINLSICGLVDAWKKNSDQAPHIITTTVEHPSVLASCRALEARGAEVTYIPVDATGLVSVEKIRQALRPHTALVSVMYANNEIGTIYPIADIGRMILKWRKEQHTQWPAFHSDACQAATLPLSVESLHVDLLSMNGSKMYGPKGVGFMYKRRGIQLTTQMHGGGQEMGLRSGTQHVAGIVGMGVALQRSAKHAPQINASLQAMRNALWQHISNIPGVSLNGPTLDAARLPGNLHIRVAGIDAEALVLYLDQQGIAVGTGSACATGSDEGSHVLRAIGLTKMQAAECIRMTLPTVTTDYDVSHVAMTLRKTVDRLRRAARLE